MYETSHFADYFLFYTKTFSFISQIHIWFTLLKYTKYKCSITLYFLLRWNTITKWKKKRNNSIFNIYILILKNR